MEVKEIKKILSTNVLTILKLDNSNNNLNGVIIIGIYLPNGTYNGQLKKVVLHPKWDDTNNGDVNISINRFCDPDGSIYEYDYLTQQSDVPIVLNKAGQSINLIYVDDDNSNTSTSGYWMLLDNNFDFI